MATNIEREITLHLESGEIVSAAVEDVGAIPSRVRRWQDDAVAIETRMSRSRAEYVLDSYRDLFVKERQAAGPRTVNRRVDA